MSYRWLTENSINVIHIHINILCKFSGAVSLFEPVHIVNLCSSYALQGNLEKYMELECKDFMVNYNIQYRPKRRQKDDIPRQLRQNRQIRTVLGFGSRIFDIIFRAPGENQEGQVNSAR